MIRFLLHLYIIVLIIDAILSFFPQFRYRPWAMNIRKAADFTCAPVRRKLPPNLPVDLSPLIVILLLKLVEALW